MAQNNEQETPTERIFRIMQENQRQVQEQVTQLTRMMDFMMRERGRRDEQQDVEHPRRDNHDIKIDVESFDGVLDPERYLEWEKALERYFDFKEVDEDERRYKIAKVKLKNYGEDWLKGEQRNRRIRGKAPISTWSKLKKRMRDRFVPTNYKQQQYIKWSTETFRGGRRLWMPIWGVWVRVGRG